MPYPFNYLLPDSLLLSSKKEVLDAPSFEDKLPRTLAIIQKAVHALYICSGEFSSRYYDHPLIMKEIDRILRSDGCVVVSAGPSLALSDLEGTELSQAKREHQEKISKLSRFKKQWVHDGEWAGHLTEEGAVVKEILDDLIGIRPVLKFFFYGVDTAKGEKNRIKFYFNHKRDPLNYLIADSQAAIIFDQPIMQSEAKKVYVFSDEPLVERDLLHNEFLGSLKNTEQKQELVSEKMFFEMYKPELIDTKSNFKKNPRYETSTFQLYKKELLKSLNDCLESNIWSENRKTRTGGINN